MSFLHPEQLAWALLAGAVALFYWRSLAPQAVETPALGLWQKALARRPAWSGWQRIVSLALQIAVVLLLALALAQPFLGWSRRPPPEVVIVVDCTASMKAKQGETTRFDLAVQKAREIVGHIDSETRIALVAFGTSAELLCPLGSNRTEILSALDRLQPTDGAARVEEALQLAGAATSEEIERYTVVVSDRTPQPTAKGITFLRVENGTHAPENRAITRLAARPDPVAVGKYLVLAEVGNFSGEKWAGRIELRWQSDAQPAAAESMELAANGSRTLVLSLDGVAAGMLTATLGNNRDALASDDAAQVRLPLLRAARVVLVRKLDSKLERLETALRSAPRLQVSAVQSLPALPDAETVYVLSGELPAKLPPRALVVDPAGDCELFSVGPPREEKWTIAATRSSPLLEPLPLGDVIVERARMLEFRGAAEILAQARSESSVTPVLATIVGEGRRTLVLNIDLATSDLLLRRGAPEMLGRACEWLLDRDLSYRTADRTTDSIAISPADAPRSLAPQTAGGSPAATSQAIPSGAIAVGPLPTVGERRWANAAGQRAAALPPLAVNLLDAAESNLASEGLTAEFSLSASLDTPELGWWFAGLAFGLLVLEWLLFHRRVTT